MAIYTVTNTDDSGSGSLRDAIAQANDNPGSDTIDFIGSVFEDDTADTITLTSGELSIIDSVTINGLGADRLTVSGNNASRVFKISTEGTEVTIDNLTVARGRADFEEGGGIFVGFGTTLNVNHSNVFRSSTFVNGRGGGIYNLGTATLINSTISGNVATEGGGGIYNSGIATLTNSTVSGNSSVPPLLTVIIPLSFLAGGGGIYNTETAILNVNHSNVSGNRVDALDGGGIKNLGTATLTNSTVSGNFVGRSSGGGISNGRTATLNLNHSTVSNNIGGRGSGGISNGGTATLTNSTVSGNRTDQANGGIANGGILTLTNSTVSGNTAAQVGGIGNGGILTLTNSTVFGNGTYFSAGGIANNGTATLNNTIVAGSIPQSISGGRALESVPDVSGNFSGSFNLIGDGARSTGLTDGIDGNIVGTRDALIDPGLAPLADNGGTTQTYALLPGSLAINAGDNSFVVADVTTDQRGSGFPRIVDGTVDIGAYEFNQGITLNGTNNADILTGTDNVMTLFMVPEFGILSMA